jgi:glutamyl-tRNA reductase
MGRLAARAASRHGARVLVANRSPDRAGALAREVGGEIAPFGPIAAPVAADGVVVALAGSWPLSPAAREALLRDTFPIVDLSSPPALEPAVRTPLGSRYTSVDDFAQDAEDGQRARLRHRMERALADAEASFVQWAHARSAVPTIRALSDHAERRRLEELDRLFRRTDLPEHQREAVEQMSRRLVAGLLHQPFVVLREDGDGELDRAARSLFSL